MVNEAMSMLRVIVPFGRERYEHQRFRQQGEVAADERIRLTVRQTLFNLGVSACTAAGTALVFYFGFAAHFKGQISIGELVILLSYIAAVYAPLEQISTTLGALHQQFIQLRSSFELLDMEPSVKDAPDAVELPAVRGTVRFDDVSFSYGRGPAALQHVNFEVPAGSRVAIVGPTGAGKTTLASLLVRFYDPQHGRLTIDEIDVAKIKLASLRAAISVVPQEPLLFSGTIDANIRYGRLDATQDDVVAAAKAANAHDFIVALPLGYETLIGERGSGLSGGERQRLAIARAFLKDAPILVLDEPTSSIDSRTEEVILTALDCLVVGRTSFTIAHRLSTIRDADLILVMDHGQIAERGTHEELLARHGVYRQLHDAQVKSPRTRPAPQMPLAEHELVYPEARS
jgi:ABC-type multidrug transport system fused ATPase/permease subunit